MPESATSLREERKVATAARLIAVSRQLTLERGISGFTVEELCAEVGISRRTFFNYFPSKDEAVLGIHVSDDEARIEAEFLALGSRGWPSVLDDLTAVAIENVDLNGHDSLEHAQFFTVLEREPKLLARFIGITREREQALAVIVAQREGVDADDLRAQGAVTLFSTVLRSAVEHMLRRGASSDFGTALHNSLAAIREVAATSSDRKDHP